MTLSSVVGSDRSTWSQSLSTVMATIEELGAEPDTDRMLLRAVEAARQRLGLERVGIYVRERGTPAQVRGTWGTDERGCTADEHDAVHMFCPDDYRGMSGLGGTLWLYRDTMPLVTVHSGSRHVIGQGWLAITPMLLGGEFVGVMYNDSALTHAAVNEEKQLSAALFCRLLTGVLLSRSAAASMALPSGDDRPMALSTMVQGVLAALKEDPTITGNSLALMNGVSPGHLARCFKVEMGMSLVEYRNRLRIERFLETTRDFGRQTGDTLLRAALDAGFGSYTQFYRVHKKLLGRAPAGRTSACAAMHGNGDG